MAWKCKACDSLIEWVIHVLYRRGFRHSLLCNKEQITAIWSNRHALHIYTYQLIEKSNSRLVIGWITLQIYTRRKKKNSRNKWIKLIFNAQLHQNSYVMSACTAILYIFWLHFYFCFKSVFHLFFSLHIYVLWLPFTNPTITIITITQIVSYKWFQIDCMIRVSNRTITEILFAADQIDAQSVPWHSILVFAYKTELSGWLMVRHFESIRCIRCNWSMNSCQRCKYSKPGCNQLLCNKSASRRVRQRERNRCTKKNSNTGCICVSRLYWRLPSFWGKRSFYFFFLHNCRCFFWCCSKWKKKRVICTSALCACAAQKIT